MAPVVAKFEILFQVEFQGAFCMDFGAPGVPQPGVGSSAGRPLGKTPNLSGADTKRPCRAGLRVGDDRRTILDGASNCAVEQTASGVLTWSVIDMCAPACCRRAHAHLGLPRAPRARAQMLGARACASAARGCRCVAVLCARQTHAFAAARATTTAVQARGAGHVRQSWKVPARHHQPAAEQRRARPVASGRRLCVARPDRPRQRQRHAHGRRLDVGGWQRQ